MYGNFELDILEIGYEFAGCLAPYRRHKIGTLLLQHVLAVCAKEGYTYVTLHVQINNEAALAFYKKFGFEVIGVSEQYYKRIEPADAYLLEKKLPTCGSSNGQTCAHSDG